MGLGDMLAEDVVWKGQVAACNHIFAETRKAITVIACVNMIQALKGAEQAQTAETLLAKDVDVASPLLAAARDIVTNAQPTKSARKKRLSMLATSNGGGRRGGSQIKEMFAPEGHRLPLLKSESVAP